MLEAKQLAEVLSKNEEIPTTFSNLDDHDLDKVLNFCNDDTLQKHKIRYSDGVERTLDFD